MSNTRPCPSCAPPTCLGYADLFQAYKTWHASAGHGDLDIYFEGFVLEDMKSSQGKRKLYQLEGQNRLTYKLTHKGKSLKIYNVRKNLYPNAFFHKSDTLRTHAIDIRLLPALQKHGFELNLLLKGYADAPEYHEALLKKYPTKAAAEDMLEALAFREDTKIAKQFRKIPSSQQSLMRRFFKERMKELYARDFFGMTVLLMDIYALCRFLRFFERQPVGSTSIFFAGVQHCWNYQAFLTEWGATPIFSTMPVGFQDMMEYVNKKWAKPCVPACTHIRGTT